MKPLTGGIVGHYEGDYGYIYLVKLLLNLLNITNIITVTNTEVFAKLWLEYTTILFTA